MGLLDKIKRAWNVFSENEYNYYHESSYGSYYRPDRVKLLTGNDKSIINSIFNRIAMDVSTIDFVHCKVDKENRFESNIYSGLQECLSIEANIDQTARAMIQDLVLTMLDEGCAALVPVDTKDGIFTASDILTMRVGKIKAWYPSNVKVELYNDKSGKREEIMIAKSKVAIIENPMYSVINEPNSTLQRLIKKMRLLDIVDEQSSSGKLDLIVQLPYLVKSESRKQQADERRREIERQLTNTKYGIAYVDGTEKITQLNRPVENNLMKQIEYLTNLLYSQLGVTLSVFDGTADEKIMKNYYSRTIEPIASAIAEEIKRKFITKTARTQGQTILFFRDPFKLVPVSQLADIADKFTRNEIMTSNEIRQVIGKLPSKDPKADQLINSNLNHPEENVINQNGNPEIPLDDETDIDINDMSLEEIEAELALLENNK